MDRNQEEKNYLNELSKYKKGKIISEINNKLEDAQGREDSNDNLIKGTKEKHKNNQGKKVT